MYSSIQQQPMSLATFFRWAGRVSGFLLFVAWLALVIQEAMQWGVPSAGSMYQGVAFAFVFAGYALGLRYELAGGLLAILGTIAFFAIVVFMTGIPPHAEAAFFAIPGVLYLLAWRYDLPHHRYL